VRGMKRNGAQTREVHGKVQRTMNSSLLTLPIKSKSDKKDYRLIKLGNGLRALLIHHEWDETVASSSQIDRQAAEEGKSDKSASSSTSDENIGEESEEEEPEPEEDRQKLAAVALNIGVGSFQDPSDFQGLAHFVEHMIFMGSEKFPKENGLDQFLSSKGGASNAHTEIEYTLFYFDIVEEFLADAVDRFASLFVSPLMLRDSMSREIEAVESEFQNGINDDDNRIVQIFASKANGAVGTFTWGNLRSLRDEVDADKLYDAAHEFRKKHYVANNMCLCIESAESLDNLQRLVEKHFMGIKSGTRHLMKQENAIVAEHHFKTDFFEKMYYVKPKGDKCKLYITWVMPSMEKHYKTKPHDYLAYIIQHEGVGSLNSYLKRK
jgi:nardilysin